MKHLCQYTNLPLDGKYSVNATKQLRYEKLFPEKWYELVVCCFPYNALALMKYAYATKHLDSSE